MMTIPDASSVVAFEAEYAERARCELGSCLDAAEAVVLDRLPLADGSPAVAGWWCREDAGDGLIVLPNPWNDRAAIEPCVEYASGIVDFLLTHAGDVLQEAHSTRHTHDYWDVLLRPWLAYVVHAALDRRMFCAAVGQLAPNLPVAGGPLLEAPATMAAAVDLLRGDAGNRSVASILANRLGLQVMGIPQRMPAASAPPPRSSLAGRMVIALELVARVATDALASRKAGRKVALVGGGHLSPVDTLRLLGRMRGFRAVRAAGPPRTGSADPSQRHDVRRQLGTVDTDDPRVLDIAAFAGALLPRTLVEDYAELVEASQVRYGSACVAVAGNYGAQDVETEFLARCAEKGKLRAFVQHGGTYLQARVNAYEQLEIRPWAVFASWGGTGPGVRPLPSPHLARIRDSSIGGERIVIIEWLPPPDTYVLRIGTKPLANQSYPQHDLLADFVRHASPFQNRLFLKRFPYFRLEPERNPAVAALPNRPPATRRSATRLMQAARLCVVTYPDTPFIEAMAIGVPTIGLWDPALWELRDDAQRPFDALREAGVLFSDPRAAASHVQAVHERAADWWSSAEIQEARQLFLERFAIGGDWLAAWSAFLRELDNPVVELA